MLYAAGVQGQPLGFLNLLEQKGQIVIRPILTPPDRGDAGAALVTALVLSGLDLCAEAAKVGECIESGSMSTTAAQDLVPLGYTNVIEVDGGFNDWEAAGYELLQSQQ